MKERINTAVAKQLLLSETIVIGANSQRGTE